MEGPGGGPSMALGITIRTPRRAALATSNVIVTHTRTAIGTQQLREAKAVEQLYYVVLLTGSPAYRVKPEIWRRWAGIGFDIAMKVPPPGVTVSDRMTMNVRSAGKVPEISGTSANMEALQKLNALLEDIEAVRPSLAGQPDEARAEALINHPKIAQQLIQPLKDCLQKCSVPQEEVDAYMFMIRRGLLALTYHEVASVQVSLS